MKRGVKYLERAFLMNKTLKQKRKNRAVFLADK